MGAGSPRRLRVFIGVATVWVGFAPSAWADNGLPAPAVSVAASVETPAATVTAGVSGPAAPATPVAVDAVAATQVASLSTRGAVPAAPAERSPADTTAAVGDKPAAAIQLSATGGVAQVPTSPVQVDVRTAPTATPQTMTRASGQPTAALGAIPASDRAIRRAGSRSHRPKTFPLSASPQVADNPAASQLLLADRDMQAPVPTVPDRASRKRVPVSAPAPSPGAPAPPGPAGVFAGSGGQGASFVLLLAALVAGLAFAAQTLGRPIRPRLVPAPPVPYGLLLERPG